MPKFQLHRHLRGLLLLPFLHLACFCGNTPSSGAPPEHLRSFDPANGFKPAQRDFRQVFLQLAGSLEEYGDPVPFIRHVASEHSRIEKLSQEKYGRPLESLRPSYMTDAYIDRLSANWNLLAPKLGLEAFAKEAGRTLGSAIGGADGKTTILGEVLQHHQTCVFEVMAGKRSEGGDFASLRSELGQALQLDPQHGNQSRVTKAAQAAFAPAVAIRAATLKIFARLDTSLSPADAERVKTFLTSVIMDLGQAAESELRAGLAEWALETPDTASATSGGYDPRGEAKLSADERKTLAALVSKPKFTKADFATLDRFYSSAYDRLSERGKGELSRRVWAGTH